MTAIIERELKSYFNNLTGYVFGAFLLLFAGIYTMAVNLYGGSVNFEFVLSSMSFIFVVAVPILSMRVFAEERRQKTDQLLYSLPLGMTRVVLGKYFAMLLVILLPILIIAIYPILLTLYGPVSLKVSFGAIIGFFLLAATLAAIGMLISSFTENQAVAAGLCFVVMLALFFLQDLVNFIPTTATASLYAFAVALIILAGIVYLLTKHLVVAILTAIISQAALFGSYYLWPKYFENLFGRVIGSLAIFERLQPFVFGIFDLTLVVYYLTIITVVLFLTVHTMEKRRWS